MKKRSNTKVKAAPAEVKATTPLKKVKREPEDGLEDHHKRDVIKKEQSDTKEMIKGIAGRLQRMEEKLDMLISSSSSSNGVAAAVKTGSVKAESESSSSDEKSSSDDESSPDDESSSDDEPAEKKAKEDTKTPKEVSTSDDSSEESDEKEIDTRFGPGRGRGRGRGLFVGGRFGGGRCGGRRLCYTC